MRDESSQDRDEAEAIENREAAIGRKRAAINRVVLLILVIAGLFVVVPMLKIFLAPLLLAGTFSSLFFPLYTSILGFFRGNRGMASLSCCAVLVLGIVIPAYFLGYLVTHQLLALYQSIEPSALSLIRGEHTGILARIEGTRLFVWLTQHDIDWQRPLLDVLKNTGAAAATLANKTSIGALHIIAGLLVTLFIMFYLFMDGKRILLKIRQLFPLRSAYQDMIITRFLMVSRATVKGTLIIALIQGALGSVILLVFGVKTWLLWGVVMSALGLVPLMGTWPVLVPAGIIQMASGHAWQGMVIIALNFGVVSTIDNILRPRLVGQGARMHDLLIFFSTVGGLAMFGPVGVLTGPVIMAFFVSVTEICTMELKEHLD